MKAYLLVFGGSSVTRDDVARFLDECEEVSDWRSDLPFAFYIHSDAEAKQLSDSLKNRMVKDTRLFVTEISDNSDGFITKDSWYFLLGASSSSKTVTPGISAPSNEK